MPRDKERKIFENNYDYVLRWLSAPRVRKEKNSKLHPGFEERLDALLRALRKEARTLRSTARNK